MKLLKKSFRTIVILNVSLNNINLKLTFVQSMFSSIDMHTPSPEIKNGFSKVKEYILT